ncbi:hypothetical protein Pint_07704 [Pistacia integerrima]|uniref:Uncharacterized protein n=1 Tax=Pistacia integerrima TaxID=434235 RepID=A0ACC0XZ09_9ROSI|nr:hypothetical protein Pint_07704 [Pistacia integerrima]
MAAAQGYLYLWIVFSLSLFLALAQEENQFIYHGFNKSKLQLGGLAKILPNGLLRLTNTSELKTGYAFYPSRFKFNSSTSQTLSFSTTFAFAMVSKASKPLLSKHIDLSEVLLESMYVGLSAATALAVALITVGGAVYIVRKKKYEEVYEDWEKAYGPHRLFYKNLYKATKGFKEKEVIGQGELLKTGKANNSTDVFAFGAFMLEVACGRRPIEPGMVDLAAWVIDCWKGGAILDVSDPRLEETRPSMKQVTQYLDREAKLQYNSR